MGHDPQTRVEQASDQAIKVKDRVDVAGHASGQIPGKAPARGQAIHESQPHATDDGPTVPWPAPDPETYRSFNDHRDARGERPAMGRHIGRCQD